MSTFGERLADMVGEADQSHTADYAEGWHDARATMAVFADKAQDIHGAHSLTLDSTAQMMLDLLRATPDLVVGTVFLAEKPEAPDPETLNSNSAWFEHLARAYDKWERHVDACYLMLNARLRDAIEDQLL